ncbi:hypothetical protein ABIB57_000070 [Devosia sp. UYZn731]|uniref:hypothetical protein n=1 Tax=Devosia sp. UYZn731 TaxID=3156345 RepID=UPI003399E722
MELLEELATRFGITIDDMVQIVTIMDEARGMCPPEVVTQSLAAVIEQYGSSMQAACAEIPDPQKRTESEATIARGFEIIIERMQPDPALREELAGEIDDMISAKLVAKN